MTNVDCASAPSFPPFTGVIPPVITPRTADGAIDTVSLERVVAHLLDGGVHGLFILGSSSEVPYLTDAERDLVTRTVVAAVGGRVPVLAGANDMTTARVAEIAAHLETLGVDALVVTTPYYALTNDSEIAAHFRAVKARTSLPIFAYDVPVRTHAKLSVGVITELAADGTIVGVKDSSGDDVAFRMLALATRDLPGFRLFTGHEVVVDGAMLSGAHGAVPGLGNVDPAGYVRLHEAAVAGDWEAARAEQDRLTRLFAIVQTTTPGVSAGAAGLGSFKTALQVMGVLQSNTMSIPMQALDADDTARIRGILAEAGLV